MSGSKSLTAAGGVLWRDGRDGPEVLLVHRPRHDDWSLPKGKPDPGENTLDTAIREVVEETGLRFTVGPRLGAVTYPVHGRPKTVTYWAMRLHPEQTADPTPRDDREIDDVQWHTVASARKTLTYLEDHQILKAFTSRGLAPARLILVRHALAGKRSEWSGQDSLRPLDERGVAQVAAIGRSVSAFGPTRLICAPLVRCIQTAEPIAATAGLSIEQTPTVADSALKRDAAQAVANLAGWATNDAETVVVVSQGDLIKATLDELLGSVRGGHPRRKGSAWVICSAGGRLVSADYYPSLLPPDDS